MQKKKEGKKREKITNATTVEDRSFNVRQVLLAGLLSVCLYWEWSRKKCSYDPVTRLSSSGIDLN